MLAAALRAGLNLPHSCKGGHCASCRARLLSGETIYPTRELPAGITPEEAAECFVLLCQAQAITDITIETREMRLAPEVEVKSLPSRIDRMERLADDVMAVFLRLPAVEDLHYRASQYIDFILSGGRRRSFSLASAPGDGRMLEVHVQSCIVERVHRAAVRHHACRQLVASRGPARAVLVPWPSAKRPSP